MPGFIADSIIVVPAAPAHPDAALINRCAEFIIANDAYEAELSKPEEEGDGPVCVALKAQMEAIKDDVCTMQATTLDGCLAVARCFMDYHYHEVSDSPLGMVLKRALDATKGMSALEVAVQKAKVTT